MAKQLKSNVIRMIIGYEIIVTEPFGGDELQIVGPILARSWRPTLAQAERRSRELMDSIRAAGPRSGWSW